MGLDMYLIGAVHFHGLTDEQLIPQPVQHRFRLAYWRKHPDLHGYIVNEFANGEDNCQEIPLTEEQMHSIIDAIRSNRLPHTEGFFFGESKNDLEEMEGAIDSFEHAITWSNTGSHKKFRYVYYQASW